MDKDNRKESLESLGVVSDARDKIRMTINEKVRRIYQENVKRDGDLQTFFDAVKARRK